MLVLKLLLLEYGQRDIKKKKGKLLCRSA